MTLLPSAEEAVVGCFLSYSHDDDEAMNGVASEIRNRIQRLYRAKTGRSIRIFVDRDDIGWGTDWRDSITESVRSATAFIPLITMNYFNREACREELMAYYNSARAIGVTELVLPIVLAGASRITESDAREEVRIIERLQFENLEEIWPYGFSSPEWMRAISGITDKLILALDAAETRIAELESSNRSPAIPRGELTELPDDEGEDEEDNHSGVYALMEEFGEASAKFGEASPKATEDLNRFSSALTQALGDFNTGSNSPTSLRQKSILAANALKEPSLQIEKSATEMLTYVSEADGALRQIVAIVDEFDIPIVREALNAQLDSIRFMMDEAAGDTDVTEMDQIVEMVKFVGSMNVSLRRSIRPGYRGVAAIRDAMKILLSWREIPLLSDKL